ncbi:aminomethyl-transferring glycine dehydrogenase subunit GcvPA [Clostridium cylindrosporum]|uniref:Probable glycine dehydrogenase (decarboxylating) subunit 1 n=1 Tax=Clostridium cylindrosporum DSM 605 TaxID=1121307 RepID=A0A0J8D9F8_CLOCY|nr:aminomethyl-transferring glycine dehydrogenase subunit GcvPA [Clostridium cylindrosporum]KMT20928.1 putative glycine dehydrogenase (decarboxylating) subunit 1 [Clostridium cylindrosporum DSM 605]
MFPYIPNTCEEREAMLKSIGMNSIDDLFSDIPEELKLNRRLDLEAPYSELEISRKLSSLSNKNLTTDEAVCFLGAGAYDHYVPSAISHIVSRSEFYTAYTPYQPEISQGTLQVIFEYQSLICELTGMDVANASMYDAATAVAEAAMISASSTRKKKIVVSKAVQPEARRVLATYMDFNNIELVEVDVKDGVTDLEKLEAVVDNKTAGVIIQSPNFFGCIEDAEAIEKITHANKANLVMSVDPISLGILKTPGEIGADIVVGDGQSLGNYLSFGGPYLGFMAVTNKLMRKIPGRVVGQTEDSEGKRAFVLTLQAREQHIRREKATSNICSNQGLIALRATIYMSLLGKKGIKEVATQCLQKAHYAFDKLVATGKVKPVYNAPFFKEFAVELSSDVDAANAKLKEAGIIGGYNLGNDYEDLKNATLICVTEKRTKAEIDKLADVLGGI